VVNPSYGFNANKQNGMKPIAYEPLSGIAVFPVLRHTTDKAFGDLPNMFAREYSAALSLKAPQGTKVYNPSDTVSMIRLRGLGGIYDQIMTHYTSAGRPDPSATDFLLKQLAEDGRNISRIVFVESDLDMNAPDEATGLMERISGFLTDGTPKAMKGMVRSRIQVFDTENPEMPRVWAGSWQRSVKINRFRNMTPSVFDDSDSEQALAGVSRRISQELFYVMPREAYMVPVYDTNVHGRIIESRSNSESQNDSAPNRPDLR
jgi:hypothetical protein